MKFTICHYNGCYSRALEGMHYCELHKSLETMCRQRKRQTIRKASKEYHYLYETREWRAKSKDFLIEHPFCVVCGERATVVDHITPHRGDLSLFWNDSNLQSLCVRHHNAKTRQEKKFF